MSKSTKRSTFGQVIQKKGREGYYARFRRSRLGVDVTVYAGPEEQDALDFCALVRTAVTKGVPNADGTRGAVVPLSKQAIEALARAQFQSHAWRDPIHLRSSFTTYARQFLEARKKGKTMRPATLTSYETILDGITTYGNPMYGAWTRRPLQQLAADDVHRWVNVLKTKVRDTTIKQRLVVCRSVVEWAKSTGKLDEEHPDPFATAKHYPKRDRKHTQGTREQTCLDLTDAKLFLERAGGVVPRETVHLLTAALFTGWRWGDLTGLRWSDVAWDDPRGVRLTVRAANEKTSKTKHAYAYGALRVALEELRGRRFQSSGDPDARVFVQKSGRGWVPSTIRLHMGKVLDACPEIPEEIRLGQGDDVHRLTFHGLRRSARQIAEDLGVPDRTIDRMMGWSHAKGYVGGSYSKRYDERIQSACETIAQAFQDGTEAARSAETG